MSDSLKDVFDAADEKGWNRREFLRYVGLGWGSLIALAGVSIVGLWKFLLPNVLYEPPSIFKVGMPESFPEGVSPISGRNVFLIRNGNAFHAISSVCTHLGCQVTHVRNGFQCPCHGSTFDVDGNVTKGAAPRPLEWYEVTLAENGEVRINMKVKVKPGTKAVLLG